MNRIIYNKVCNPITASPLNGYSTENGAYEVSFVLGDDGTTIPIPTERPHIKTHLRSNIPAAITPCNIHMSPKCGVHSLFRDLILSSNRLNTNVEAIQNYDTMVTELASLSRDRYQAAEVGSCADGLHCDSVGYYRDNPINMHCLGDTVAENVVVNPPHYNERLSVASATADARYFFFVPRNGTFMGADEFDTSVTGGFRLDFKLNESRHILYSEPFTTYNDTLARAAVMNTNIAIKSMEYKSVVYRNSPDPTYGNVAKMAKASDVRLYPALDMVRGVVAQDSNYLKIKSILDSVRATILTFKTQNQTTLPYIDPYTTLPFSFDDVVIFLNGAMVSYPVMSAYDFALNSLDIIGPKKAIDGSVPLISEKPFASFTLDTDGTGLNFKNADIEIRFNMQRINQMVNAGLITNQADAVGMYDMFGAARPTGVNQNSNLLYTGTHISRYMQEARFETPNALTTTKMYLPGETENMNSIFSTLGIRQVAYAMNEPGYTTQAPTIL